MPVAKRPVSPTKPAGGSVNLGDPATYYGGGQFDLPPGKYALECATQLFTGEKRGEFLCVMVNFHPLEGGEPIGKPLSLGSKAHLSYVPSADGKGIDLIPGSDGKGITSLSNFGIFRKSLEDCGLPPNYLQNDVTVLNGTWVVTDNTDNEERKKLKDRKPKTGEAAGDPAAETQSQFENKQVVCIEIMEGGRPWEGTGGFEFPAAETAPAPKTGPRPIAPKAKAAPMAPPQEEEAAGDEDLETVVQAGITAFLEKPANAHGCTKLQLRSAAFAHVKANMGDDSAQEAGQLFNNDATVNTLLAPLGYKLAAGQVKPA